MAPSDSKLKNMSATHRKQLGKAGKQMANTGENHADVMAAIVTNAIRSDEPSSAITNPSKSIRQVKFDYADDLRERVKQHLQVFQDHLKSDLTPGLVQLALQMPKASLDAIRDALLGVRAELGTLTVNVGLLKSHGWQLKRLADFYMVAAKGIVHRAQTVILQRAPALLTNVTVEQVTAAVSQETLKDAKIILSRDEIHRLSNHLGIDAKTISLLTKLMLVLRSEEDIEMAALKKAVLSAKDGIDLTTIETIKSSAKMHSICDLAGGNIKVSNGVIDLNPLGLPPVPTVPVVVLPVVLADDSQGQLAGVQVVPQYEGMAAHGTSFA